MKSAYIADDSVKLWYLFFALCLVAAIFSLPYDVLAAGSGSAGVPSSSDASAGGIATTMCKITKALTGPIGKAVATIAVVVLGIGLFLGKLSWGLAMATAIGIGLIFSAPTIVEWLGGSAAVTGTGC